MGTNLCTKIVVTQRIFLSLRDVVFIIFLEELIPNACSWIAEALFSGIRRWDAFVVFSLQSGP